MYLYVHSSVFTCNVFFQAHAVAYSYICLTLKYRSVLAELLLI